MHDASSRRRRRSIRASLSRGRGGGALMRSGDGVGDAEARDGDGARLGAGSEAEVPGKTQYRMLTRNNRLDYELFFSTRGAFRPLGWSGLLVVIVYFSAVLVLLLKNSYNIFNGNILVPLVLDTAMLVAVGQFLSPGALKLVCNPLRRAMSLWSPLVAILLMLPCMPDYDLEMQKVIFKTNSTTRWILYPILFVFVLLLTISRLRFPCIVKLVDSVLSSKQLSWRPVILNWCMFAAIVVLVFTFNGIYSRIGLILYQVCALVLVSFRNFQIPAAVVRVMLAVMRLIPQDYVEGSDNKDTEAKINLGSSLNIFYGMVLGQGLLYLLACLLEVFSFIPRRSLVRRSGFRGQLGVEYVRLYYAYAFEKCIGGAVLTPKKISLVTFAMDSLSSDSSKNKLYGVQVLHSFLKEPFRAKTTRKLTTSTKTLDSLFNMLGWTSEGDTDIRLFAAKVIAQLADSLRVVPVPGAMQLVASLLDTDNRPKIRDPLLCVDSQEARQDSPNQQVSVNRHSFTVPNSWKQMIIYCLIPVDDPSSMDEQNSPIQKFLKHMTKCWSIPEEEPPTERDLLPVLGLLILDRLANFDLENCMEISRTTGLISKIIDFTGYIKYMTNINEAQQITLTSLSLKVLRTLARTKGKLGVTLREKVSGHPFLLSNLAEILDDSGSNQELREMAAEILAYLATDGNTSEEIGQNRVIISSLMHAFLNRDACAIANSYHLLQKIAGQALAMLAMESVNNCLAMLTEPGYAFIKELIIMIHDGRCKYTAASLLRNMCVHAQPKLSSSDLKDLSHPLREVLEGIMCAEGKGLEVLIGLSSQICNVVQDDFVQELEQGQIKERFVERLVHALNANMKPNAHCPSIRRVIVEHAIYLMECNSSYANSFHKCWMMEALSMVERTPSRAENYRLFLGDAGLMKHSTPISTLVARAKELMGHE